MSLGERQWIVLPLMFIVALIILGVHFRRDSASPTAWDGTALRGNAQLVASLNNNTAKVIPDTRLASQLEIEIQDDLYSSQGVAFKEALVEALAYGINRFGTTPKSTIKVMVIRDPGCSLRGITYAEQRTVQVYTCATVARGQVVNILAHEFIHQLAYDRYGPAERSDQIMVEGVATWGAAEYWLNGQPDLRTLVRQQRNAGSFYPLSTDYTGLGIGAMNVMYYEWASFVDYLIGTYGRSAFDQAYLTGAITPGSADYQAAYGKDFAGLEREWQDWLDE